MLPGIGGGRFGPANDTPVPRSLRAVAAADMDGDGKLDIVCWLGDEIAILLNAGQGMFYAPEFFATNVIGLEPGRIAVGDLNGDSRPDIVTATSDFMGILTLVQGK
jgi:hypothetical protein